MFDPLGMPVGAGVLCLTGTWGAFAVQQADAEGQGLWDHLMLGGPPFGVVGVGLDNPYQVWYRDVDPGGHPTSNASNAVLFRRDP